MAAGAHPLAGAWESRPRSPGPQRLAIQPGCGGWPGPPDPHCEVGLRLVVCSRPPPEACGWRSWWFTQIFFWGGGPHLRLTQLEGALVCEKQESRAVTLPPPSSSPRQKSPPSVLPLAVGVREPVCACVCVCVSLPIPSSLFPLHPQSSQQPPQVIPLRLGSLQGKQLSSQELVIPAPGTQGRGPGGDLSLGCCLGKTRPLALS